MVCLCLVCALVCFGWLCIDTFTKYLCTYVYKTTKEKREIVCVFELLGEDVAWLTLLLLYIPTLGDATTTQRLGRVLAQKLNAIDGLKLYIELVPTCLLYSVARCFKTTGKLT